MRDLRSTRVLVITLFVLGGCIVGAKNDPSSTAASNTLPIGVTNALSSTPLVLLSVVTKCSADMVLVEGDYCPKLEQQCFRWLDGPGPYHEYRCGEYKKPVVCNVLCEKKKFCIDREEYVKPGETLLFVN